MDIFRRANVQWNNYILAILVQGGFISGYAISSCIISSVKRKHHFAFSAAFMGIFQAVLGFALKAEVKLTFVFSLFWLITFFLKDFGNETFIEISQYILPTCVVGTTFAFGCGVGPVPMALLGEIIPLKIKSVATAILLFFK